jgi:hypothetical protein
MSDWVRRMGLLRLLLLAIAILNAVSMLWVDTSLSTEGWGLLRAAVLPALAPIIIMVLILDFLMCRISIADNSGSAERRSDLSLISKIHLLVMAVLLLSWLPVLLRATYL